MAEAVKNSGRTRRPPSHLREDYQDQNFQVSNLQQSRNRDASRQSTDPCPLPAMARLLSKFLTSINKKHQESIQAKAEMEARELHRKIAEHRRSLNKEPQEDKQSVNSKIQPNSESKPLPNSSQLMRPKAAFSDQKPGQNKPNKSQHKTEERRGSVQANQSIEGGMTRQQWIRSVPDAAKGQIQQMSEAQIRGLSRRKMQPVSGDSSQRLFGRCAYHVGIAYSIHIQNIRQKFPDNVPPELDPIFPSRRMKVNSFRQQLKEEQSKIKPNKCIHHAQGKAREGETGNSDVKKIECEITQQVKQEHKQREEIELKANFQIENNGKDFVIEPVEDLLQRQNQN